MLEAHFTDDGVSWKRPALSMVTRRLPRRNTPLIVQTKLFSYSDTHTHTHRLALPPLLDFLIASNPTTRQVRHLDRVLVGPRQPCWTSSLGRRTRKIHSDSHKGRVSYQNLNGHKLAYYVLLGLEW